MTCEAVVISRGRFKRKLVQAKTRVWKRATLIEGDDIPTATGKSTYLAAAEGIVFKAVYRR